MWGEPATSTVVGRGVCSGKILRPEIGLFGCYRMGSSNQAWLFRPLIPVGILRESATFWVTANRTWSGRIRSVVVGIFGSSTTARSIMGSVWARFPSYTILLE